MTSMMVSTASEVAGVVILRLDGGLFFATSDALEDRVQEVTLKSARNEVSRDQLRGDPLHRLSGVGQDTRAGRAHKTGRD